MPWTETAHRESVRHTSDLTDREWVLIEPFMPPPCRIGRPRATNLREVVNAMLYQASTGCHTSGGGLEPMGPFSGSD